MVEGVTVLSSASASGTRYAGSLALLLLLEDLFQQLVILDLQAHRVMEVLQQWGYYGEGRPSHHN